MKREACGLWRHWPGTVWFIWSSFPAGAGVLFLGRDGGKDGSVRVDSFLEEAIVRGCSYSKKKLLKPCLGFEFWIKELVYNITCGLGACATACHVQSEPRCPTRQGRTLPKGQTDLLHTVDWPTRQGRALSKGSNWSAPHCGLFLTCLGLASASQNSKVFLLKMPSCWRNNP